MKLLWFLSMIGFGSGAVQQTQQNETKTPPQFLGADCESKQMKNCGSTGPYVCYEHDEPCPGYGPLLRGSRKEKHRQSAIMTSKYFRRWIMTMGAW